MNLQNYALGEWVAGTGKTTDLVHAVTGEKLGETSSGGLDFRAMAEYARAVGGPKLRAMTFHERARMLKAMAKHLMEHKDRFYEISAATGATRQDSWVDIEGGIGTFFAYGSRGRRDFPDETFYVDGAMEPLSKGGTFVGRHLCVPLEGVAVHINAFNFPCWGMLEKLAPTLLAGVPAIVKPATVTSYLTEAMVREMIAADLLPEGALQLICGSAGDLLSHLEGQDAVAFTGSAATGRMLKQSPAIVEHSVRFNMEADSLNCSILGPDAAPGTDEFDLFIKEVVREMTTKAGQKCTAIRRTLVPAGMEDAVVTALRARLDKVVIGNPAAEGVRMGPLASRDQVKDVGARAAELRHAGQLVYGGGDDFAVVGADRHTGAFFGPMLLVCDKPFTHHEPHDVEAFGPVNTVMPYASLDDAVELAKLGRGSLCGSLFTADPQVARQVVLGVAPYHGRFMVLDRTSARESTGHGSPLPNLVHGGPGRAGGGEEMGGVRGVLHYMQRTAVQGSPSVLTAVMDQWMAGAAETRDAVHPFRKHFEELEIGETLRTGTRTFTEADVEAFADLSGDHFYAHMDDDAARTGIFERRVVHGYLVLSAAAGLFVDPAPGPVLANYGLDNLRFTKPVYFGDTIHARLTCKQKTAKETPADGIPQGVVAWDVEVWNQHDEPVALYTILTLVRRTAA
ncbi:MAG TPA: phenylacetic acid degradation bifunctional protein PaaZ [Gemmatimonadaceae bacterium]|nr:phenylacetic acid degradation bifunctional protein PaaZ [Gemmatimonadaceae bacterium]